MSRSCCAFPRAPARAGVRNAELVDLLDLAPHHRGRVSVPRTPPLHAEPSPGSACSTSLPEAGARGAVLSRTVWNRPRYSWRDERLKLIFDTQTGEQLLFDLERDPGESTDRADGSPLLAAYARQELFSRLADLAGPPEPVAALGADARAV